MFNSQRLPVSLAAGLFLLSAGVLLWVYWNTITVLAERWDAEPLYSHCFVVPIFSLAFLWLRREELKEVAPRPNWLGVGLILAGVAMRLAAGRFYLEWFDGLSLIPCFAGVALLIGGTGLLRVVYPAVLFLGFMVPLPFRIETALAGPLQSIATKASTFGLQLCGYPAISEGNIIAVNEYTIGVAEACSGLRMLVVFFAVSTAAAICIRKPLWEKGLVVSTALPIAIFCNVVRIVSTGMAFEIAGRDFAKLVFHDFAGWMMMILAVALLRLEIWILSGIIVDPPEREVVPVLPESSRVPIPSPAT